MEYCQASKPRDRRRRRRRARAVARTSRIETTRAWPHEMVVSLLAAVHAFAVVYSPSHGLCARGHPRHTCMSATRAAAQDLRNWVEEHGGAVNNVLAGPTQHGLGLLATEAIKNGDVAVRVPKECLIYHPNDEALLELHNSIPEDFWAARLALLLLAERSKGEASPMKRYLDTLPASFTVPLFWTPKAISTLKYPTVQQRLLSQAKFIQAFATEQLTTEREAGIFAGRHIDADAFGWAVAASSSRAVRVDGHPRLLCPFIDLGNHAAPGAASCELRGTQAGGVELVALRDIELGEELTYDYGARSNDDFLLEYGFLPAAPNRHDDVALAWADGAVLQTAISTAGLDRLSLDDAWRRAALRTALPANLADVRVTPRGVDRYAMAACRIAAASDPAALRAADGGMRPLLAAGSEVTALRLAAAMAAMALTSLPEAPDEEGSADTEGAPCDAGEELAGAFLAQKRALCSAALAHVTDRIKALRSGEARAELRGTSKGRTARGVRKTSASRKGMSSGRNREKAGGGFGKR